MALAIKYEYLICKGLVQNQDELAELAGVDRSLISRILRLRQLSPKIQEWLLNLPEQESGNDPVDWTDLHPISRISSWKEQRHTLNQLIAPKGLFLPQADGLASGYRAIKGLKNKEK
jgi:transcriptional regulator with XRE-family HTH domain